MPSKMWISQDNLDSQVAGELIINSNRMANPMFKIGDFSKICQVSIKALRHWEREDLLNPTYTDPETCYRYYDIQQLQDIHRIIAYKSLGLSLKEIQQLMRDRLPVAEIRGMLKLKQSQIRQQVENYQAKLQLIEARLNQIEQQDGLSLDETILKPIEPQQALTIREQASSMNDLVDLIRLTDKQRGSFKQYQAGPIIALFHDSAYQMEMIDVELGFSINPTDQVDMALADPQEMRCVQIPAIEMAATTIHQGSWLTLSNGYGQLGTWISHNGYEIAGVGREIFHHIDWDTGDQTITEIQFPVRRRLN